MFVRALPRLYPTDRFFGVLGIAVVLSAAGYAYGVLYWAALLLLVLLLGATLRDAWLVVGGAAGAEGNRNTGAMLSVGDETRITIRLRNASSRHLRGKILDELPPELLHDSRELEVALPPGESRLLSYPVRPTERGDYHFGRINLYLRSPLGLLDLRVILGEPQRVPAMPSIVQMKRLGKRVDTSLRTEGQLRKRQVARSYAFDQIKEYVVGDDYRSINWRATGRRNELMVNRYSEERAQRIYCVVDVGRSMRLPFNGLTLLDYAVNASLALSNVIIKKRDRAGLLTFGEQLGQVIAADNRPEQLGLIARTLFNVRPKPLDSNYELLYYAGRRLLGGRSTIFLFTNFESPYSVERVLPSLRRLLKLHRVIVILFENTEITDLLGGEEPDAESIYYRAAARQYLEERQLMVKSLRVQGIETVYTRPEDTGEAVVEAYLSGG